MKPRPTKTFRSGACSTTPPPRSERERTDLEDTTGSVKVGAGLEPVRVRSEHVEVDVGVQGRAARGDRCQVGRVDVDCLEGEHGQRSSCLGFESDK